SHSQPPPTSLPPLSPHGATRALPSFPTRRSSDLSRTSSAHPCLAAAAPVIAARATRPGQHRRRRSPPPPCPPATSISCRCSARRSEEHTSELQSRENLVCRLLLEKKNTQKASQLS